MFVDLSKPPSILTLSRGSLDSLEAAECALAELPGLLAVLLVTPEEPLPEVGRFPQPGAPPLEPPVWGFVLVAFEDEDEFVDEGGGPLAGRSPWLR